MTYWYRQATDAGDRGAMYLLALNYDEGVGVPKSTTEAVKWYTKSAELGHARAMYVLGQRYQNSNPTQAFSWFQKAADSGDTESLVALGSMYETGRGVSRDESKALYCYLKAGGREG
jgi:TPR repeat protein